MTPRSCLLRRTRPPRTFPARRASCITLSSSPRSTTGLSRPDCILVSSVIRPSRSWSPSLLERPLFTVEVSMLLLKFFSVVFSARAARFSRACLGRLFFPDFLTTGSPPVARRLLLLRYRERMLVALLLGLPAIHGPPAGLGKPA